MFLELNYSPAAPWGPCWSYSYGAGAQERPSARCMWQRLPKKAAFLPAALVVLPGFPGTHSPHLYEWLWVSVRKSISLALRKIPSVFFKGTDIGKAEGRKQIKPRQQMSKKGDAWGIGAQASFCVLSNDNAIAPSSG